MRASLLALAPGLPLSIAALELALAQGIVIAPLLVAVAAAATCVPARRAALVDPARTLRVE